MRSFSLLILVLALSGCRTIMDPTFFPTSYAHHTKEYKAPPGPEADKIGYKYSEAQNTQVVASFIKASTDLVGELEKYTGLQPQTVHIENKLPSSAFNNTYDYALREAFRAKGYTLADASQVFDTRLSYEAIPLPKELTPIDDLQKKINGYEDFDLLLNLFTGETEPQTVRKTYALPSFGSKTQSVLTPPALEVGAQKPQASNDQNERTRNFTAAGAGN